MASGHEDQSNSRPRRVHHVPPPTRDDGRTQPHQPPGVMWPEPGSGFEPSYYSPAGRLQQEVQIASNLRRDPAGVWRAVRTSWGVWILVGGLVLFVALALISAALH